MQVIKFVLRAACTLQNTDGEQGALFKFSARCDISAIKGQMRPNLDNFSFVEHETKSTLKNKFCVNCGAQDTKIRRFLRAS